MHSNIEFRIIRIRDNTTFIIGGDSDWGILKKGLDGWGEVENDLNFVANGVHDGGIHTSDRLDKVQRTIKTGYLNLDSNDVERDRVQKFFNVKDTFRIYVTYANRTRWADAKIRKFALSTSAKSIARMDLTIQFEFANPFMKSFDDFGSDIASVKGLIGFPYMVSTIHKPTGLTGGAYNFAQNVLLNNDGDVETFCKAVMNASGTVRNPSFSVGEKRVRVIDTLQSGDELIMDFTTLPPKVTKNGFNWIGHCDRLSDFTEMAMPVGDVAVRYDADDGENNLSVSLYYNKLYASV